MSIEALVQRAHSLDLRSTAEQRKLTARYLRPRLEAVVTRLGELRASADVGFAGRISAARAMDQSEALYGDRDWRKYPIGFCRQIRDAVLDAMRKDPLFQDLQARGLILKPVFIFLKESYFQNAIQLGDYYLDVANDTVVPEKPKLDWSPIARTPFENLESWSRFAEVARRYLRIEIYPNYIFPLAFAGCPFVAIRPNGRLELLLAQHQIALKDLADGMRRTRTLLDDTSLMERRLPPEYLALLERKLGANLFATFPLEFQPTEPSTFRAGVIQEFIDLMKQPSAQAWPVVKAYFDLIEKAAQQLRLLDIRPPTAASGGETESAISATLE